MERGARLAGRELGIERRRGRPRPFRVRQRKGVDPRIDLAETFEMRIDQLAYRKPPPPRLSAGSVLIREWHGLSHRVAVLKEGMLFRGTHYRSLSEVARQITGTRWSGPRFFGLRAPTKETERGAR